MRSLRATWEPSKGSFGGSSEGSCGSLHSFSNSPLLQRCLLLLDAELHVLP